MMRKVSPFNPKVYNKSLCKNDSCHALSLSLSLCICIFSLMGTCWQAVFYILYWGIKWKYKEREREGAPKNAYSLF